MSSLNNSLLAGTSLQYAPTEISEVKYNFKITIEDCVIPAKRLKAFISKLEKTDCWEYTGPQTHNGYGAFGVGGRKGKNLRAHRLAYQLWVGEIPVGQMVLHKCNNRICCNPWHLYIGSAADNTAQMMEEGRGDYKNMNKKITPELHTKMRSMREAGMSNVKIGKELGVSHEFVREHLSHD